jgi:hypothetical protein
MGVGCLEFGEIDRARKRVKSTKKRLSLYSVHVVVDDDDDDDICVCA